MRNTVRDDEGKRTEKWTNLLKNLAPYVRKSLQSTPGELAADVAKVETLRQTVSFNIAHLAYKDVFSGSSCK